MNERTNGGKIGEHYHRKTRKTTVLPEEVVVAGPEDELLREGAVGEA